MRRSRAARSIADVLVGAVGTAAMLVVVLGFASWRHIDVGVGSLWLTRSYERSSGAHHEYGIELNRIAFAAIVVAGALVYAARFARKGAQR